MGQFKTLIRVDSVDLNFGPFHLRAALHLDYLVVMPDTLDSLIGSEVSQLTRAMLLVILPATFILYAILLVKENTVSMSHVLLELTVVDRASSELFHFSKTVEVAIFELADVLEAL